MEYQEFPKMLYHIVESPVIVGSKEEEKGFLDKGWSTTPVVFDAIKIVQAKIAYHKSEIERLSEMLAEFDEPTITASTEPTEEKFICDVCNFEARSKAGLAVHRQKHKVVHA